jgi:hypothetical protein
MAFIQDGSAIAGNVAVDTVPKAGRFIWYDRFGQVMTKRHADPGTANDEGLIIAGVNDANVRHLRADRAGGLASANATMLLSDAFEGSTPSTSRWNPQSVTMSSSQSPTTGHLLNSGSILTANTGYMAKSLQAFLKMQRAPLHFRARARLLPQTNGVMEMGFGDAASAIAAHSNGAYWQVTAGGVVQPVLTFGGVDIAGAAVAGLSSANYYTFDVIADDDFVTYTVQDTATGLILAERVIKLPLTQPKLFGVTHIFGFYRLYINATGATIAPQMYVSAVDSVQLDAVLNKPWAVQTAQNGGNPDINPLTFAAMSKWTNNAAEASATLSNTAAGYAFLQGRFQFAAIAGAETDYALFGFQIPSPYRFTCLGAQIDATNYGAAVATTATTLEWWLAYDQTAVSLATVNPLRVPLGGQSFAIGDAIGKKADTVNADFKDSARVTHPGRFCVVALRMPLGTATASQIIRGNVRLDGPVD